MAETHIFRQNPAHDVERLAAQLVTRWVGMGGTVQDTSAGPGPDFRIAYCDGRQAIGEVAWHEDPQTREMWSNAFRYENHQQIMLGAGQGQWAVDLVVGANIKKLYQLLPAVIGRLINVGHTDVRVEGPWQTGDLIEALRDLGIELVRQTSCSDPPRAVFFMPSTGGVVPEDPNVVTDWVELVLADPDYADTTAKLLCRDADERHVFLMSGSRTDFGHGERLRRMDEGLPTRDPQVPDGITHVWTISQFGTGPAALWVGGSGWSEIPTDASEEG
jgi:hypothetical protein